MLGRTMRAVRLSEMRVSVGLFGGGSESHQQVGCLGGTSEIPLATRAVLRDNLIPPRIN